MGDVCFQAIHLCEEEASVSVGKRTEVLWHEQVCVFLSWLKDCILACRLGCPVWALVQLRKRNAQSFPTPRFFFLQCVHVGAENL